jgi:Protein of unknown function (DUF4035)
MTVTELRARMPASEFDEWVAFFELEPRGDERLDLHVARMMHLFTAAHSGRKRRRLELDDFMVQWRWRAEADSDVDEARRLLAKFEEFEARIPKGLKHGRRNR